MPEWSPINKCRSCQAKILWAKTTLGANMPVDYDPEIEYLWEDRTPVLFEPSLMISHFSTCPQSDKWRNRDNG